MQIQNQGMQNGGPQFSFKQIHSQPLLAPPGKVALSLGQDGCSAATEHFSAPWLSR